MQQQPTYPVLKLVRSTQDLPHNLTFSFASVAVATKERLFSVMEL